MAIAGAVSGYLCMTVCKRLAASRTENGVGMKIFAAKYFWLWCLAGAAGFALISISGLKIVDEIEYSVVFALCMSAAAVDLAVKKIPNILLLILAANKALFLILGYSGKELTESLIGFAVACVVFSIPALFKLSVGAGDIKLAAVTGLYLGIYGFLQAMIIMAAMMTLYGICKIIRKTGGLKSKTAMGPYIALGLFVTALFPLI
jgi:prepilin signal peptidase PulO-like enzyme (type II secretory pathway)